MYAAIDEDSPLEEVNKLLERVNIKIEQYQNLFADCSEAWKKNLNSKYLSYVEETHKFKKQLKEKYGLEQRELNLDEYNEYSMLVYKGLKDLFSEKHETIDTNS